MTDWEKAALENNWEMPSAPRWKRFPLIRHLRAIYHAFHLGWHERIMLEMGFISTGYDRWVLHGIWKGKER